MQLYALLDRAFPRSYLAKVVAIVVVGTHLPLVAVMVQALALPSGTGLAAGGSWRALLPVLAASVLGTLLVSLALRALLAPLFRAAGAMADFERGTPPARLPEGHADSAGQLMSATNRLVREAQSRIGAAEALAERDPLTGLLNRRGLERALPALRPGAVVMLDLDHFKAVND